MRNPWFRGSFCMNLTDLLALKPEELSAKILERRRLLAKALPEIEARMTDDADALGPLAIDRQPLVAPPVAHLRPVLGRLEA